MGAVMASCSHDLRLEMDWNRRPDRSDRLPTGGADDQPMNTTTNTPTTPDLSFYFAIHRHMRSDLVRFVGHGRRPHAGRPGRPGSRPS